MGVDGKIRDIGMIEEMTVGMKIEDKVLDKSFLFCPAKNSWNLKINKEVGWFRLDMDLWILEEGWNKDNISLQSWMTGKITVLFMQRYIYGGMGRVFGRND